MSPVTDLRNPELLRAERDRIDVRIAELTEDLRSAEALAFHRMYEEKRELQGQRKVVRMLLGETE